MTGSQVFHGVRTPNPVRRPDILARVKAFVEADPKAATGPAIIALVMSEFQVVITRNQIAGAFLREGIKRGGYSRISGEGEGHNGEATKAKFAADRLACDRAAIAEQQRLAKASIMATPRALTMAPRERPSRAIRVPKLTMEVVIREVPMAIPKLSRRITECCWPIGHPGTKNFRYCDDPHRNRVYCDVHERSAYTHKRQENAA